MKLNTRFAIALVATATSVFGLASGAMAGEGGAAGAAAFTINATGGVTGVAVAAAVGKNDAAAAAYNRPDGVGIANIAYALGSAGLITLTNPADPLTATIAGSDAVDNLEQANTLTPAAGTIVLGTTSGATLVTLP